MNRYGYLILGVIGGVALGFTFGRAYGIRTGMQIAEERYRLSMAPKVEVVVAVQDIPGGTILRRQHLGKVTVFLSSVRNEVRLEDAHLILGRKLLFAVKDRQAILWADIEGGRETGSQQPARGDSGTRAADGAPSEVSQP